MATYRIRRVVASHTYRREQPTLRGWTVVSGRRTGTFRLYPELGNLAYLEIFFSAFFRVNFHSLVLCYRYNIITWIGATFSPANNNNNNNFGDDGDGDDDDV